MPSFDETQSWIFLNLYTNYDHYGNASYNIVVDNIGNISCQIPDTFRCTVLGPDFSRLNDLGFNKFEAKKLHTFWSQA